MGTYWRTRSITFGLGNAGRPRLTFSNDSGEITRKAEVELRSRTVATSSENIPSEGRRKVVAVGSAALSPLPDLAPPPVARLRPGAGSADWPSPGPVGRSARRSIAIPPTPSSAAAGRRRSTPYMRERVAQLFRRGAQALISQSGQSRRVGFPVSERLQHTTCTDTCCVRQQRGTRS
jgi:hypothetical protein